MPQRLLLICVTTGMLLLSSDSVLAPSDRDSVSPDEKFLLGKSLSHLITGNWQPLRFILPDFMEIPKPASTSGRAIIEKSPLKIFASLTVGLDGLSNKQSGRLTQSTLSLRPAVPAVIRRGIFSHMFLAAAVARFSHWRAMSRPFATNRFPLRRLIN